MVTFMFSLILGLLTIKPHLMKKIFTLVYLTILLSDQNAGAQNCNVAITGGSCIGTNLSAGVNGGDIAKLSWYRYNSLVYAADTISSSSSMMVVAGNNGTGSAANQFKFPSGGMFVDSAGNVYVADILNQRIQKWAPGATVGVTVAGGNGQGSAANQLSNPRDVFVDAANNVYVSDGANHRIQKWAPGATSGVTVAGGNGSGTGAKQLSGPRGIYVDKQGNIYIADAFNYRIQRWKAGANKGVTVAGGNGPGTGANQLNFPIDVYLDGAKNVYIADANLDDASTHRVQKWAPGATSGITVAGGNGEGSNANQFGYLLGIFVADDGTVYAADNGISGINVGRIQKWLPGAQNGITVAGGHSTGWDILSYPTGVMVSKNGFLYVLDGIYSPKVQKYKLTNGIVDATFAPSQPGAYTVQALLKNGCTATSNNIIVYAKPEKPIIYPTETGRRDNLCEGGIDTFLVDKWDDITTYKWKLPAKCSLVANKNDSVIISVPAGFNSGKLTVKGNNICGTGLPDTLILLGRPVKPRPVTGLRRVFPNQLGLIYSVPEDALNHHWIVPPGAVIQSGQGTRSIVVDWGTSPGTIGVNSYNNCGISPYKFIEITLRGTIASNEAADANVQRIPKNDALLFPNPSRNNVTVKFSSIKQMNYTIELQNMNGKILMQKNITAAKGVNQYNLDISRYAAGVYLINIKNAESKISLKLTKQ